jgi:rhodanese-related sulfurtransferase
MKKLLIITLTLVLTFALAGLTMAGKVPTPTNPPTGVQMVSASDAENLVTSGKAQVFDMRKALNYGKGHVPGAVSLPYKWTKKGHPAQRTGEFDMSKLPQDKSATIVFHSDGPNGWKSYYASKAAVEKGHKNVLWMREGFSTWAEKGYTVEN